MIERIKAFAANAKEKVGAAFTRSKLAVCAGAATAATALMSVVSGAEGTATTEIVVPKIADSITSGMMNGIFDQITSLLPVVLPVMVACLAFRKGLSFFQSLIRGL